MVNGSDFKCERFTCDTISVQQYLDLSLFVNEQFLKHPNHQVIPNMQDIKPAGLLYNIKQKFRWNDNVGSITILKNMDKIIGISCSEISLINPKLGIGGIRCWLDDEHRANNLITKYLLSDNFNWCIEQNLAGMLLTFNDYNKWIYDAIVRTTSGKTVKLSKVWSNWWDDCIIIDRTIEIRNVFQWCVIKPINVNECIQIKSKLNG